MTSSEPHSKQKNRPTHTDPGKGLIFAWEILGDGKGRKLHWKDIHEKWREKGLFWLHLNFEDPHAKEWLVKKSGVEESLFFTNHSFA